MSDNYDPEKIKKGKVEEQCSWSDERGFACVLRGHAMQSVW